jgi:hypothetical protein
VHRAVGQLEYIWQAPASAAVQALPCLAHLSFGILLQFVVAAPEPALPPPQNRPARSEVKPGRFSHEHRGLSVQVRLLVRRVVVENGALSRFLVPFDLLRA